MKEYIDADKLAQAFATERSLIDEKCKGDELKYLFRKHACNFALYMISVADKEDVAPVIHAHWIEEEDCTAVTDIPWSMCSACGSYSLKLPYCAFCGAKMDEKEGQR